MKAAGKKKVRIILAIFVPCCSVLGVSKNAAKYIRKLSSKCDASFLKLFVVLKSVLILLHLFF